MPVHLCKCIYSDIYCGIHFSISGRMKLLQKSLVLFLKSSEIETFLNRSLTSVFETIPNYLISFLV